METHEFLLDILIILAASKLFSKLAGKFDLPNVVGLIVAGVVIGPGVLNIISGGDTIESIAQLGVILLMFSAGVEADFSRLKKTWGVSLFIASSGIIFTLLGITFVAGLFGLSPLKSVFFAVALCSTSISVVAQTLHEMGKLNSPAGSAIVGAAVFDDILGVIVLSLMSNFAGGEISYYSVFVTVFKIIAFLLVATVLCYFVYKSLVKFSKRFGTPRSIAGTALIFAFFLSWVASKFGMADIIGAYFAGLAFCQFVESEAIKDKVEFLSSLFFTPVFFISIGLKTTFGSFTPNILLFCVVMIVVGIITKLLCCSYAAHICKYNNLESVQIGIGMVSRGEVALIVANKGIFLGLMDQELFSPLIIIVIATTILTPIMLKYAFYSKNKDTRKLPVENLPTKTANRV